jgi:hypothetical protein
LHSAPNSAPDNAPDSAATAPQRAAREPEQRHARPTAVTHFSEDTVLTSFRRVTYSSASAGFLGIALLNLLATGYAINNNNASLALDNAISASVCVVAGVHYVWMRSSFGNKGVIVSIRFSDWYITTVLMLIEFFSLSETLFTRYSWLTGACVANMLMLISGHVASIHRMRKKSYCLFYLLGIVFGIILVGLFVAGTHENDHRHAWMYGFASVWILYPVAFVVDSELAFNVLDLVSKGVFGITLAVVTIT